MTVPTSTSPDPVSASSEAAAAPAPATPTSPTPPKKTRLIRWWGVIALIAPVLIVIIGAELSFSSAVRSGLVSSLSGEDLQMSPETTLSASLLRGLVAIDQLRVSDQRAGADSADRQDRYVSDELRIDVDTAGTLLGRDWVIQRLASNGTRISLRRRSDGTIPGIPEDIAPASDPDEPWDLPSLALALQRYWQIYQDWDWVLGRFPTGGDKPPPKPDPSWQQAVYHPPQPGPSEPSARLLIRELLIAGNGLALPNALAADGSGIGAFDITTFQISGQQVSMRLEAGENMLLNVDLSTHAAGALGLSLDRSVDGGALNGQYLNLPLPILSAASGDLFTDYGAQGQLDLQLVSNWDSQGALSGTLTLNLKDLQLQPSEQAGSEVHDVARILREAPVSPIVWTLQLSGTLAQPRLSGLDGAGLKRAILDSSEGALRGIVENRLRSELDSLREQGSTQAKEAITEGLRDRAGSLLSGRRGGAAQTSDDQPSDDSQQEAPQEETQQETQQEAQEEEPSTPKDSVREGARNLLGL